MMNCTYTTTIPSLPKIVHQKVITPLKHKHKVHTLLTIHHTVLALSRRTGFSDIPSMSSGMLQPARSRNVGVYKYNILLQQLVSLCVCVCAYVCVCVCMYACACTCVCVCAYSYACARVCACVHVAGVHVSPCVCVRVCACVCMCVRMRSTVGPRLSEHLCATSMLKVFR